MPGPFGTLVELCSRLDWTLRPEEERIATGAIEDASNLARAYGRDWEPITAPQLVQTLVLKAVVRYMRNPDGYTQSRAGDEALAWNNAAGENAGTVYFTNDEIDLLKSLAGRKPTVASAPVLAWGPQRSSAPGVNSLGYVPVDQGKPFPLYNDPESPW